MLYNDQIILKSKMDKEEENQNQGHDVGSWFAQSLSQGEYQILIVMIYINFFKWVMEHLCLGS